MIENKDLKMDLSSETWASVTWEQESRTTIPHNETGQIKSIFYVCIIAI